MILSPTKWALCEGGKSSASVWQSRIALSESLGFLPRNSSLIRVIGGMASAAEVESPRKAPTWPFFKALRDSVPFMSVSNDCKAPSASSVAAADIEEDKARKDSVDTTEGLPKKPKNKDGKKKKEIVSSSTVVPRLEVCIGKKCKAKGSQDLLTSFQTASDGRVEIAYTKCMHECKKGMNTRVTKDGTTFDWYHETSTTDVEPILCKQFDW